MNEWKEAVERSRITRIPYKKYLGMSLTEYVKKNYRNGIPQDEIVHQILQTLVRKDGFGEGSMKIQFSKVVENVKISVSARITENKIYSKELKGGNGQ